MKHISPQFDLPAMETAFNLAVQCTPAVEAVQPVKPQLDDTDDLFGPVISRYTRAQAIADGVLVDMSECLDRCPFKYPVAMTRGAYEATIAAGGTWQPDGDGEMLTLKGGQDVTGRFWDVCNMILFAMRRAHGPTDRVEFSVLVDTHGNGRKAEVELYSLCGPGDNREPVITILLQGED